MKSFVTILAAPYWDELPYKVVLSHKASIHAEGIHLQGVLQYENL